MIAHEWHIGICGTFDIENYGDLSFPLLAEAELGRRLGAVKLHPFSYHARAVPDWPYPVTPVTDLPALAGKLDGLLIGGGELIRFDKAVAPGYGPPAPGIHHPTGYWLTPMLIAQQHGCPVVWNAPGACGGIPAWAEALLATAIRLSLYVSVRDAASRALLEPFAPTGEMAVVPDTAFGVGGLVAIEQPSDAYQRLRASLELNGPYVVVQATAGLQAFSCLVSRCPELFKAYQFVIVPIGPVLGDHVAILDGQLPGAIRLAAWPGPLLITELIANAAAAVGVSLHLAITALAFGVPIFRPADTFDGKYAVLRGFETAIPFASPADLDPHGLVARFGRANPIAAAHAAARQVSAHWDAIASALISGQKPATLAALGQIWQLAPGWLEAGAERAANAEAERDRLRAQRDTALAERDVARTEQAAWAERAASADAARSGVQAERDELRAQRAAALVERDATLAERDTALAERDAARTEQAGWAGRAAAAETARAAMQAERDRLRAERDVALANRDTALAERDAAQTDGAAWAERAAAAEAERDSTRAGRDAALAEQAVLAQRAAAALAHRDNVLNSTSWKATAPLRAVADQLKARGSRRPAIIDLTRIAQQRLETEPYQWGFVNGVFAPQPAAALATSYPRDHFKLVRGYDGEKGYEYHSRSLIRLEASAASFAQRLSPAWRRLAKDLLSPAYRQAMTQLTGLDLTQAPIEVNVFHYSPGSWLGPHLDLRDKLVTHVFYFNQTWHKADGGCLTILRSPSMTDVVTEVLPIVGNSSVLVRSDTSWHAVSRVVEGCQRSRRSMTVTFYRPGSKSTMWPDGETPDLHDYDRSDGD